MIILCFNLDGLNCTDSAVAQLAQFQSINVSEHVPLETRCYYYYFCFRYVTTRSVRTNRRVNIFFSPTGAAAAVQSSPKSNLLVSHRTLVRVIILFYSLSRPVRVEVKYARITSYKTLPVGVHKSWGRAICPVNNNTSCLIDIRRDYYYYYRYLLYVIYTCKPRTHILYSV